MPNWRFPKVMGDVTLYSGALTALRPRVLTHDEKSGELLVPERLSRVVALDAAGRKASGSFPPGWLQGLPALGPALKCLHTLYLNDNGARAAPQRGFGIRGEGGEGGRERGREQSRESHRPSARGDACTTKPRTPTTQLFFQGLLGDFPLFL